MLGLVGVRTGDRRFDLQRLDDDGLVGEDEAELAAVFLGECRRDRVRLGSRKDRQRQRGVRALVAKMRTDGDRRRYIAAGLGGDVFRRRRREFIDGGGDLLPRIAGSERDQYRTAAVRRERCEADAIGRQQPRQRMNMDRLHAEDVGDRTGVLAAGAAEANQRVAGDVAAALHRDLADRVRHIVDGDGEETVSDFFRRAAVADLGGECREFAADDVDIERTVLARSEHRRERTPGRVCRS